MRTLIQDLRFGARMLVKKPGFTSIAVITLALGIGANTAILSVAYEALLRPMPYRNPDRLVMIHRFDPKTGDVAPLTNAGFFKLKAQNNSFEGMELAGEDWVAIRTGSGDPERLLGLFVPANLFPFLGVQAARGRTFLPEEEQPGRNQVAVISHGFWRQRFDGDEQALGKKLTLNGRTYTIVGVMPPDFQTYRSNDLWAPLTLTEEEKANDRRQRYQVMARLKPGVTIQQAQSEVDALARRDQPDPEKVIHHKVISLREELVEDTQPALLALLVAVGFILMIACANVANLTLARAATRQQEVAIRLALGASRWRLIRLMLTESLLLGFLGSGLGLLVSLWVADFLSSGLPDYLLVANPHLKTLSISLTALGFTLALALLTSVIFGLAPALQSSRQRLNETLAGNKGAVRGFQGRRFRQSLIVSEVALALALLIGSALMLKSFWRLTQVNPGFNAQNLLTFNLFLPEARYPKEQDRVLFFEQALERIRNLPGVNAAGMISNLPVSGGRLNTGVSAESSQPSPAIAANWRAVTPGYFRAMQTPLRSGRYFDERDTANSIWVGIVSESLARRLWPNQDPIGKRLAGRPMVTVVGVVDDIKMGSLKDETPLQLYMPYAQIPWWDGVAMVVRTTADPLSLTASVRQEVLALDPDLPVFNVNTMEQVLSTSVTQPRFYTLLLNLFSGLALLLAGIGVYGVMSYAVAQRTHEIGVRVALGAQDRDVLKLVVKQGMMAPLLGVALGLITAFALTRLMENLLFGVSATDPLTFVVITLLLTTVALLACYIPARRAARIDPMVALRCD
jgi:putative ABC transport system permease protein